MQIIKIDRSIIPACDVDDLEKLTKIVKETSDIKKVGGYKIGLELSLRYGLKEIVRTIRNFSDKPIIYDHQKAATDIPDLGKKFCEACKEAEVDAIILFPQSGPETERAWIEAAKIENLGVIVGGEMTHKGYLERDGGWITNDGPKRIYEIAAELGVKDFVVPGNKPEKIIEYKKIIESKNIMPVLYSPGLIAQGGEITESAKAAGRYWHAIIGRALYEKPEIKKVALELVSKI